MKARFLIVEKPSKLRRIRGKRDRADADRWERMNASLQAKVEDPFRMIKRQFCCVRVRYRGLAKNLAQVLTLFALSNLWVSRRRLLPAAGELRLWSGKAGRKAL